MRAADAEINDDLVPAGLDLPATRCCPVTWAPTWPLAEQYFEAIRRVRPALGGPGSGQDGPGSSGRWDCGSGADGFCRDGDNDGPSGLSGWQARPAAPAGGRRRSRGTRQQAGNVPAGLLRWARETLDPQVDWRKAAGR